MKRQQLSIAVVAAAALTLGTGSAWSQDRGRPQGERPSGGESAGSAVPRGGGGDSGSSSSSAAGSGSSAGSTADSGSGGSNSGGSPSPWSSAPVRERAPVHPDRAEQSQRRGGGSSSGTSSGRAVPRGESGGGEAGSAGAASSSPSSERQPAEGRSRAVPTYSRPRDGRSPVGTAVERTSPIDRGGVGNNYRRGYYYDPYYSLYYDPYYTGRYSYWSPFGYGYGLGYFSYDPFLFGGYGYPGSYGNDPYYGGGAGAGYGSRYNQAYRGVGSMRLKVKPANAQVYVDGYYVGVVDSFDGTFQRLSIEGGSHRIELRAEGYESVEFDVMVTPGEMITYKGEMKSK